MHRGQFGPVVRQFQRLLDGQSVVGDTEWRLLRRYLEDRDEAAFEAIVTRHGPMVLGVCRRMLPDPRDAEDAFQATFLILARKGKTLGESDPIGHWLYGVAYRVALRARAAAWRRRSLERPGDVPEVATADEPGRRELGSVVDEEVARLPAKYRAPVVLCFLEGLTHEEAGRHLDWPLGTVKGRLARAKEILKGRLSRRGLAPANGAALIGLVRGAQIAVPPPLLQITLKAANAGRSAGMVPAAVASLAAGSFTTMFLNKMKAAGAILLVLGTGAAVMAYQGTKGPGGAPPQGQPPQTKAAATHPDSEVTDWVAGWPDLIEEADKNPGTRLILGALDQRISMNFPNETPLEDVIKYVQQSTEAPNLKKGIPIYVDPVGLQEAGMTMASTVAINLDEIPLKTTLRLALRQLGLVYEVKEGVLVITSETSNDAVTPLSLLEEKALRGDLSRTQYKQFIEMLKLRKEVQKLIE